jgi:hypothetical protein
VPRGIASIGTMTDFGSANSPTDGLSIGLSGRRTGRRETGG